MPSTLTLTSPGVPRLPRPPPPSTAPLTAAAVALVPAVAPTSAAAAIVAVSAIALVVGNFSISSLIFPIPSAILLSCVTSNSARALKNTAKFSSSLVGVKASARASPNMAPVR